MDKNERKELRTKLLNELYDYHFENKGKAKPVAEEIKDNEVKLAYVYLNEKGLVDFDNFNHHVFAAVRINTHGIDEVEK